MNPQSGMTDNFLQAPEAAPAGSAALDLALPMADDHPALAGHFPGRPIVPGVVLLDRAMLAIEHWLARGEPAQREISSAKFLSPLLPGQALHLQGSRQTAGDIDTVRFELSSGSRRIASASVRFHFPPAA